MSPSVKHLGPPASVEDRVNARQGMNRELTVAVARGQVEFFIKQHPFSHDPLTRHTVLERRTFTREVYDYARRHGLNSVEAQQAIRAARQDYRKKRHLAKVLAWVDEAAQAGRTMQDAISDIREEHGWDTDEMEGNFDTADEGTNFGSEVDDSEQFLKQSKRVMSPPASRMQLYRPKPMSVSHEAMQMMGQVREEHDLRLREKKRKDKQERRQGQKSQNSHSTDTVSQENASERPSKKRKKQQETRHDKVVRPSGERPPKRSKRLAAKAETQLQTANGVIAADRHSVADDEHSQAVVAQLQPKTKHDQEQKRLEKRARKEKREQKRLAKVARISKQAVPQEKNDRRMSGGLEDEFAVHSIERGPSQHTRAATAIPVVRSDGHASTRERHWEREEGSRRHGNHGRTATRAGPSQQQSANFIPIGPRNYHGQSMPEHRQQQIDLHDALLAHARRTVEPAPAAPDNSNERSVIPRHAHGSSSSVSRPYQPHSALKQTTDLPRSMGQLHLIEDTQHVKQEEDRPPTMHSPTHPPSSSLPASQPPLDENPSTISIRTPTTRLPSTSPYFLNPRRPPHKGTSCIPFPPISHPRFGLIQESVASNPFQLLIAVNFLNRTRGMQAIPAFYNMIVLYPTPSALADANEVELARQIRHLGLQNIRARRFIDIARAWMDNPPVKGQRFRRLHYPNKDDGRDVGLREILNDDDPRVGAWEIAHIPSTGPYALDSWRIFCRDQLRGLAMGWKGEGAEAGFEPEWKRVIPKDKELRAFLRWMWLKEGIAWDPCTGLQQPADDDLMVSARQGGLVWDSRSSMPLPPAGSILPSGPAVRPLDFA